MDLAVQVDMGKREGQAGGGVWRTDSPEGVRDRLTGVQESL